MIGNWSLGDYFKEEQLPWAYEFLIEELNLDPSRIYATYFGGDDRAPKDTQAFEILKNIFIKYKQDPSNRILKQKVITGGNGGMP